MPKFGISIYPERSTFEADREYLDLAWKYGATHVFTSLLEIKGDGKEVVANFKKTIEYARHKGFQVMVDINPYIFKQLGISYDDLSFFADLGANGLRLDMGFTGREEAEMTRNPYNLTIEVNMSSGTDYLKQITAFSPNKANLTGSHNFYPMEYSGLSFDFFVACCQQFRELNVPTAAFITSQHGEFGPWPEQLGLCTLEEHRFLPMETQFKHLASTGLIDTIFVGNAYATEEELAQIESVLNKTHPIIKVVLASNISEVEKEIVLNNLHSYRGDRSAYLLRSSLPRFKYKKEKIPAHDCQKILPGDLVICNEHYGQYKGELHIALKEMENRGKGNVVGKVALAEQGLIASIKPWSRFRFEELLAK